MLEGLEAVEINFSVCKSIIDFRIDANTYKKEYLLSDELIKSRPNATIEDLSISVQNFGAYSLTSFINFTEEGTPFLMTQNVRHNYIDWNIDKYVDNESHEMLWKSHCKKGQVLVTMAGEYLGRVAVYDKDFVSSSNQAIAKVTLKNEENSYITSTFLNTIHGQNQINRFKTITGQPNINMALIKSLRVPIFSDEFKILVENIIKESESKRQMAIQSYKDAESFLMEIIGFENIEWNQRSVTVKSFTDSLLTSGRLDAEYYQPKYEKFENIIKSYPEGFTYIANEFELIKNNFKRTKEYYNYIEIGDINVSDGSATYNKIMTEDLPANAKTKVEKGNILISKVRPNRGAVTIIDFNAENLIVSGAFTVLREIEGSVFSNETLKVLLRTDVYKEWLLKFNVGTQYPVIRDEDVLNLPIPRIEKIHHEEITKQVKLSQELKKQAENLLKVAEHAVEIAIEQDETTAFNFINKFFVHE